VFGKKYAQSPPRTIHNANKLLYVFRHLSIIYTLGQIVFPHRQRKFLRGLRWVDLKSTIICNCFKVLRFNIFINHFVNNTAGAYGQRAYGT
jgi:hypothetical protein